MNIRNLSLRTGASYIIGKRTRDETLRGKSIIHLIGQGGHVVIWLFWISAAKSGDLSICLAIFMCLILILISRHFGSPRFGTSSPLKENGKQIIVFTSNV